MWRAQGQHGPTGTAWLPVSLLVVPATKRRQSAVPDGLKGSSGGGREGVESGYRNRVWRAVTARVLRQHGAWCCVPHQLSRHLGNLPPPPHHLLLHRPQYGVRPKLHSIPRFPEFFFLQEKKKKKQIEDWEGLTQLFELLSTHPMNSGNEGIGKLKTTRVLEIKECRQQLV